MIGNRMVTKTEFVERAEELIVNGDSSFGVVAVDVTMHKLQRGIVYI